MHSSWWYRLTCWLGMYRHRFMTWLAWHVPRELAYWCAIRVGVHATTGQYRHEDVPGVTIEQMLQRWEKLTP